MTDDFARLFAAMMAQGQEMARAFAPASVFGPAGVDPKAFEALFPTLPREVLDAWFGRTFNPEGLDARTRFLVTIAALTVLGAQGEPQMRVTIRNAIAAGATPREVAETVWQMSLFAAPPAVQKAMEIARAVFAEEKDRA